MVVIFNKASKAIIAVVETIAEAKIIRQEEGIDLTSCLPASIYNERLRKG